MSHSRFILLIVITALIATFFIFDLQQLLTIDALKSQQQSIENYRSEHLALVVAVYASIYILVTAFSLPGAAILTLAGGAIFGLLWGTLIVSFTSSIGATLAFLAARFLFRDTVEQRFGDRLKAVNAGVLRDGAFYLFTLRLVPLFPFFLINLLMGLTSMRVRTFYWVSQVGMLAGTLVYVNAGVQLSQIDSLSDIVSPALLGAFVLLGIFPLIAKKIVSRSKLARFISSGQNHNASIPIS